MKISCKTVVTKFSRTNLRLMEPDKNEVDETERETIVTADLKPEDDEIVDLSSNEADLVQEKGADEVENR